jgi:hypothetical protein
MSKWTHLSGVVRIDRIFVGEDPLGGVDAALVVAQGHFDYGLHPIHVYARLSDTEHLLGKNIVITIEANLEDYGNEDVDRIKKWFTESRARKHLAFSQGDKSPEGLEALDNA